MKITKRNGNVVVYDDEKVVKSILNANAEVPGEELTESAAAWIASEVFARLSEQEDIITTKDVRESVFALLGEKGLAETAKRYAEFKK
ncbi:MAG: hypothetical protein IJ594_11080 [Oscillospiraceae bacterium]|nr:hypothetical protein [Oscillospiraceae bacterium]